MSTIDMKQVAGIQAVNAEGKVIGTLSVDDLTELVSAKIIQESKNEAVSARSASVMSEASTIAATDEYEDQLEIDTNPAYVRSLDSDGNPKRTATTSLAQVVGGLLSSLGLYPFQQLGIDDNDLNNFVTPGWAMVHGPTFKNLPKNAYSFGVVFLIGSPANYNHLAQFYIPDNNSGFYFRTAYSGINGTSRIGSDWNKLSFSSVV